MGGMGDEPIRSPSSSRASAGSSASRGILNRRRIRGSGSSSATSGSLQEAVDNGPRNHKMHFGKEAHYNEDIHDIAYNEGDMAATIRDRVHEHDLLVGDSPARTTQWPGRSSESSESRARRGSYGFPFAI